MTDCKHAHIGQDYDERRGSGNGPQKCFDCKKTVQELIDEAYRMGLEHGLVSLKRVQANCPLEGITRDKVNHEIIRLALLKND